MKKHILLLTLAIGFNCFGMMRKATNVAPKLFHILRQRSMSSVAPRLEKKSRSILIPAGCILGAGLGLATQYKPDKKESELIIDPGTLETDNLITLLKQRPKLFFKLENDIQKSIVKNDMSLVADIATSYPEGVFEIKDPYTPYPHAKNKPQGKIKENITNFLIAKDIDKFMDALENQPKELFKLSAEQQYKLLAKFHDRILALLQTTRPLSLEQKKLLSISGTLSSQHIQDNIIKVRENTYKRDTCTAVFSLALEKEKELLEQSKQNNEKPPGVFYHGLDIKWGVVEDFVTALLKKLDPSIPQDFVFIQAIDRHHQYGLRRIFKSQSSTTATKKKHQKLMSGSDQSNLTGKLFTNMLLFGNITNQYACRTWDFVDDNHSQGIDRPKEAWFGIFDQLNLPPHKQKEYRNRLIKLEKKLRNSAETGRLLQVVIPFNIIDNAAYLCRYVPMLGDFKLSVQTKDGKEIDKVSVYRDQYQEHPEQFDKKESDIGAQVVLPITEKYLLNPQSGIRIFKYEGRDTEEQQRLFDEYKKELQQLIDDIVYDMQEPERKRQQFKEIEANSKRFQQRLQQTSFNLHR